MPILSLPVLSVPTGIAEYLPIRVPFPFMRIASILPHSINEPFKATLLSLFRLAWTSKIRIPILITVVFMACDIRLQLEINIIWETNTRPHGNQMGVDGVINRGQRRESREDMRRAALVASAVYQQQRRRLIQEIRSQQTRQRESAARRRSASELPPAAPLATEEDSDLDNSHDSDGSESDTLTASSQRSTVSEAGMFGSDEIDTEDGDDRQPTRKRKKRKSRPSSRDPEDEDDNEDDDDDTSSEEDDDDHDNDDYGGGGGMTGGGSSHGGGRNRDDSYDRDSDDMGDDNSNEESGSYSSPLVVEVEIRHRSLFAKNDDSSQMLYRKFKMALPFLRTNKSSNEFFNQSPRFSRGYDNAFSILCPFHLL